MLQRATLMLTLAAITAVVLALEAGGAPAAPKQTGADKPIYCEAGKVCKGTSGPDTIIGSDGDDDINPFGGDDTVLAGLGNDSVRHSYGKDHIEGGPGADTLRGGFDHDKIYDNSPGQGDGEHDLLDCAWLASRGDSGPDEGFGEQTDTVVDCSNRDDQ